MRKKTSPALIGLKLITLCLVLLCAFIAAPSAFSADIKVTPGISERITWNDNMFLKEFDDIELRSEPTLNFEYNSGINQLNLGGNLSNFRYADRSEYNRTMYNLHAQARRQFSERLRVNVGGGWQQDYSLDTYWDDPTTQKTMLKRNSHNSSAGFSYALTELDTVEMSLSWANMQYVKRIPNYSDYDMLSGGISWQHIMIDGTLAFVAQGNWQRAEFDSPVRTSGTSFWQTNVKQDVTQSTYSGMAGLYWMPTDRFNIQALAGVRRTDSEVNTRIESQLFGNGKETENTYSTGFTGSANITWQYDNGNIKVSYRQEYLPSTYGELRKVNTVSFNGLHNYDQKLSWSYAAHYTNSKSDNITVNAISRDFCNFSVGPRYRFTENFSASLRYSYAYYHDKIAKLKLNANSVFLQFAFEFPKRF